MHQQMPQRLAPVQTLSARNASQAFEGGQMVVKCSAGLLVVIQLCQSCSQPEQPFLHSPAILATYLSYVFLHLVAAPNPAAAR
jgi:hypothetical protein